LSDTTVDKLRRGASSTTWPSLSASKPRSIIIDGEARRRGVTRKLFDVLGVKVDSLSFDIATDRLETWIQERTYTRVVTFTNVHAVMEARRDGTFGQVLKQADMICPDGMPLVWFDRVRGGSTSRVCGPEFMLEFFRRTEQKGYSHFFYGAAPTVVEHLAASLQSQFPGAAIAGFYSPPYRPLTSEEDDAIVKRINSAAPDVLWVGLGCPKQERWMEEHREKIRVPVMLGVGQAFAIHAGFLPQAPRWIRDSGLEWLFRLFREPRRLWRRYLFYNTRFVLALIGRLLNSD
jgi:N-acetylglucosaminyldiphosphoundecaprenol N-acetyl-beta-D-mannosaminyltransferase